MVKLVLREEAECLWMEFFLQTESLLRKNGAGRTVMDIIYYPEINEYNGNRNLQVVIRNYKFPFA